MKDNFFFKLRKQLTFMAISGVF